MMPSCLENGLPFSMCELHVIYINLSPWLHYKVTTPLSDHAMELSHDGRLPQEPHLVLRGGTGVEHLDGHFLLILDVDGLVDR